MKTRATQLKAPGQIVLAERELTVGPEEVLVKGHLSGICGSDKAMYRGDIPDKITLPLWIGHESGGTVVEVGAKVREYRPGDKVMVFNWCNTFADYYEVPVSGLQPVPDGLDMDLASLGEPIACAMYSALTCGAQLGDVVVVYGMGFAGGIIAQAVKRMGAHKVVAVDVAEHKLDIARRLGSDVSVNAKAAGSRPGRPGADQRPRGGRRGRGGRQRGQHEPGDRHAEAQRHPGPLQLDHAAGHAQHRSLARRRPADPHDRSGPPHRAGARHLDAVGAPAGRAGTGGCALADHARVSAGESRRGVRGGGQGPRGHQGGRAKLTCHRSCTLPIRRGPTGCVSRAAPRARALPDDAPPASRRCETARYSCKMISARGAAHDEGGSGTTRVLANSLEAETMYGYGGRILTIDVGSGRQTVEALDAAVARTYLGRQRVCSQALLTTVFPPASTPSIRAIWWSSAPGR